MEQKLVYKKDQRLEEIENKIAGIFSEAIYSYIIRKGLLKRKEALNDEPSNNPEGAEFHGHARG